LRRNRKSLRRQDSSHRRQSSPAKMPRPPQSSTNMIAATRAPRCGGWLCLGGRRGSGGWPHSTGVACADNLTQVRALACVRPLGSIGACQHVAHGNTGLHEFCGYLPPESYETYTNACSAPAESRTVVGDLACAQILRWHDCPVQECDDDRLRRRDVDSFQRR